MKKHYVKAGGKWNEVFPLKVVRVDGKPMSSDYNDNIMFYHSCLNLPVPPMNPGIQSMGGFRYVDNICIIPVNDMYYKCEDIEYGVFCSNSNKLLDRVSTPNGLRAPGTYLMEMKRL